MFPAIRNSRYIDRDTIAGIGSNFRLNEPEVISLGNIGHMFLCGNDLQSAAKCHFRHTQSLFFPTLCKYSFLENIQRGKEEYCLSTITKFDHLETDTVSKQY